MVYRHTIDATTYVFDDLRDLLAKATPPRSGDRLAGIAAASAAQMIAARIAPERLLAGVFLMDRVFDFMQRWYDESRDRGYGGVRVAAAAARTASSNSFCRPRSTSRLRFATS